MSSQFTREFTALAAKFEELERERRRMFRRMWFAGLAIMAAALLLLLLLGAALWTLHGKFERSKAESTAAMATLTRDGEKLSGIDPRRTAAGDGETRSHAGSLPGGLSAER